MADWRKLARLVLLAGGTIDEKKTAIVRKELFADKRIDRTELEFLVDARRGAHQVGPEFDRLFLEALRSVLLADGVISAAETQWLRNWILADGKVDAGEKKLLKELRLLADKVSPEFQALYDQCMAS
jgi:hypothetical protein